MIPWFLIIGGIICTICSLILTHDQISIWQNPHFVPACDLNPIVSCGTVIAAKQGEIFGIPSMILSLLAFPPVAAIGVAMLAGARFKRWFWWLAELGGIGAIGWALWLFYLSIYHIHALCPFCLTMDATLYTVIWYLTLYNLGEGHIQLPASFDRTVVFARRHHLDILVAWFIILIAFILHHFWYYFGQHL
jgi:uncharacterized membrane protein